MKRTRIKPISDKQKALEVKRVKVKTERINYLVGKYGAPICEFCGEIGVIGGDALWTLDMHEIDGNHRNCDPDNEYICHRKCHTCITDNNIQVRQEDYGTRELFL